MPLFIHYDKKTGAIVSFQEAPSEEHSDNEPEGTGVFIIEEKTFLPAPTVHIPKPEKQWIDFSNCKVIDGKLTRNGQPIEI